MKPDQPTAAQKRWREDVRKLGSVLSGLPAVIHHPAGRTAKHNKVHIGHWWVIPLTDEEHKALHRGEKIWKEKYPEAQTRREFEKAAFADVLENWPDRVFPPPDAERAIMDYHR